MKIGKFTLVDGQVASSGLPEPADWQAPMEYVMYLHKNINWWIGDLINMAESRFGDDVYQYMPVDSSTDHLDRCAKVAQSIPRTARNPKLSWSHHLAVVGLEHRIMTALLDKAEAEGWTSKELTDHVAKNWKKATAKKSKRSKGCTSAGCQESHSEPETGLETGTCRQHTSEADQDPCCEPMTEEQ